MVLVTAVVDVVLTAGVGALLAVAAAVAALGRS